MGLAPRTHLLLALGLVAYLALLLFWSLRPGHPRAAGLFHDDGVYLCLGRSLVERGLYRDDHTPAPIQIAKYPPGLPCLAALGLALAGEPEGAISFLRAVHALAFVLGLYALYRLLAGEGPPGRRLAPWAVAAAAFSPPLLDYLRLPMSEIPYFAIIMGLLLAARRSAAGAERAWRGAVLLATLCLAALCFRSVGAGAALALGLWLLLARRRATAWRFALLYLPPAAALQLWLAAQARPDPAFADISVYGLPYSQVMAAGLAMLPRVMAINAVQSLFYLFNLVAPGAAGSATGLGGAGWLLLWAGSLLVLLLLVLGVRREMRETPGGGLPALRFRHLFLLLSLAIVIPWPFQTARFLVPLAPLLIPTVARGAGTLAGRWAPPATAGLVALLGLMTLLGRPPQSAAAFTLEGKSYDLRPMEEVGTWLERRLPRQGLIASTMDPWFAVHHRRRGVWAWTIENQATDLYGGPRNPLHFCHDGERYRWLGRELQAAAHLFARRTGKGGPPAVTHLAGDERPWLLAEMEKDREKVKEQFRRLGVTHAVLLLREGQLLYEVLLARLVAEMAAAGRAVPLFRSRDGSALVWRLTWTG